MDTFLPLLLLSAAFTVAWWFFFFSISPHKTTSLWYLFASLFAGMGIALGLYHGERFLLPLIGLEWSIVPLKVDSIYDVATPLLFSFLFAAGIEEAVKYIFLWRYFRVSEVNQVIDGMKLGLWLGLGFAFVENTLYFTNFYLHKAPSVDFMNTLVLRGVIATLAHGLYGIVGGYYLVLAKFYRAYQSHFLKTGIVAVTLMHGFYNFFFLLNFGPFSVILLALTLGGVLYWYNERKNLDFHMVEKVATRATLPFLAQRPEIEALLSLAEAPADAFQRVMVWFPAKKLQQPKK